MVSRDHAEMNNDVDEGVTVSGGGFLQRLYTGTGAFDIIGKRKRLYLVLGVLALICAASIGIRGFNFGIDFEGGTQIQLPSVGAHGSISTQAAQQSFTRAVGQAPETVQIVGSGNAQTLLIHSRSLTTAQTGNAETALFQDLQPLGAGGKPSQQAISDSAVSGTWGGEITRQALIGLGVFLVLVTAFLAFYFERWMAVAALITLGHDILITAGVYSLVGFEVTPSTIIGLLTILGFSLYDTVVVFDKVKENTRGLLGVTRRTYPEAANLAINQTLMRSINTSLIALLPVLGLLTVGAGLLGVGVLEDLGLVQVTGILAGTLSSIVLATPLLVDLKMRDPKYRAHEQKVYQRREKQNHHPETSTSEAAAPETGASESTSAMATAGSAPARSGASGRRGKAAARPSAKGGRPSGKKRR